MSDWMKSLLSARDTINIVEPESDMHEWAEFNLPVRGDLEILVKFCEAAKPGLKRAIA